MASRGILEWMPGLGRARLLLLPPDPTTRATSADVGIAISEGILFVRLSGAWAGSVPPLILRQALPQHWNPGTMKIGTSESSSSGDCVSVSLICDGKAPATVAVDELLVPAILPNDFESLSASPLTCRRCSSVLARPLPRVRTLPSPHWRELADNWFCHGEGWESLPRGDVMARPGMCLVGTTGLLVHVDDIEGVKETWAIQLDIPPTVQSQDPTLPWAHWAPIWLIARCSHCNTPIGSIDTAESKGNDVRLFCDRLGGNPSLLTHSIETRFASDLIAAMGTGLVRRVMVIDAADRHVCLQIIIQSTQSEVMLFDSESHDPVPVIRVAFADTKQPMSRERVKEWATGQRIAVLQYSVEECAEMIDMLSRRCEEWLPPSLRGEEFRISWLRRR